MKNFIMWVLENWQTVLIPFLIIIYEFLARNIPSLKNWSLWDFVGTVLDFLAENKSKDERGERGIFRKVRHSKSGKIKFVNNNIRLSNTNKII